MSNQQSAFDNILESVSTDSPSFDEMRIARKRDSEELDFRIVDQGKLMASAGVVVPGFGTFYGVNLFFKEVNGAREYFSTPASWVIPAQNGRPEGRGRSGSFEESLNLEITALLLAQYRKTIKAKADAVGA